MHKTFRIAFLFIYPSCEVVDNNVDYSVIFIILHRSHAHLLLPHRVVFSITVNSFSITDNINRHQGSIPLTIFRDTWKIYSSTLKSSNILTLLNPMIRHFLRLCWRRRGIRLVLYFSYDFLVKTISKNDVDTHYFINCFAVFIASTIAGKYI